MNQNFQDQIIVKGFQGSHRLERRIRKHVERWLSQTFHKSPFDEGWLRLYVQNEGGKNDPVGIYLLVAVNEIRISAFDYADEVMTALSRCLSEASKQYAAQSGSSQMFWSLPIGRAFQAV